MCSVFYKTSVTFEHLEHLKHGTPECWSPTSLLLDNTVRPGTWWWPWEAVKKKKKPTKSPETNKRNLQTTKTTEKSPALSLNLGFLGIFSPQDIFFLVLFHMS